MGLTIGPLNVRRSVMIMATPERVWSEFRSYKTMIDWFGTGHQLDGYDPRLGGSIALSVNVAGEERAFGGDIVVFDTAQELSFTNNWYTDQAWPVPTFITFRLSPCFDGTMVELFHHGFERLGDSAADELQSYESGWDTRHLNRLREIIESDIFGDGESETMEFDEWEE